MSSKPLILLQILLIVSWISLGWEVSGSSKGPWEEESCVPRRSSPGSSCQSAKYISVSRQHYFSLWQFNVLKSKQYSSASKNMAEWVCTQGETSTGSGKGDALRKALLWLPYHPNFLCVFSAWEPWPQSSSVYGVGVISYTTEFWIYEMATRKR